MYTTFPPMMTSSSFDFRVYLKNIFVLEPPLKLARFVVEEVIYQNVKKKSIKKLSTAAVIAAAKKVPKNGNFFKLDILHILNFQKMCSRFFSYSKTSNDNLRNKIRFFAQF